MLSFILSLFTFLSFVYTIFAEAPEFKTYVSRPEFRIPKFSIDTYQADQLCPGYWFLTTEKIKGVEAESSSPVCFIGPYIVDGNGELVWSGACDLENSRTDDARVQSHGGNDYLTYRIKSTEGTEAIGTGVLMNDKYKIEKVVLLSGKDVIFDIHEFEITKDGKSAMGTYNFKKVVPTPDLGIMGESNVLFNGFKEVEIETNRTIFDWTSEDHFSLAEATVDWPENAVSGEAWDYFHLNSIDKFSNGDYLISSRHLDTICRINGVTGDVIWRLGGKKNDFELRGFIFSRQHNARVREENGDRKYTISFLDNSASDPSTERHRTNDHASGRIITIDENTMIANSVLDMGKPDGTHSFSRGNLQYLPNGNYFIYWGAAYHSEHTSNGSLVQFAHFEPSDAYRVYKMNFTGHPQDVPTIKSFVYGPDQNSLVTAMYVSWNGATEVRSYNFYATGTKSTEIESGMHLVGNRMKNGFETVLMYSGYLPYVIAEALDADGNLLENGQSQIVATEVHTDWYLPGFDPAENLPEPVDLNDQSAVQQNSFINGWSRVLFNLIDIFALLIIVACGIAVAWKLIVRQRQKMKQRYTKVAVLDDEETLVSRESNIA